MSNFLTVVTWLTVRLLYRFEASIDLLETGFVLAPSSTARQNETDSTSKQSQQASIELRKFTHSNHYYKASYYCKCIIVRTSLKILISVVRLLRFMLNEGEKEDSCNMWKSKFYLVPVSIFLKCQRSKSSYVLHQGQNIYSNHKR